MKLLFDHNLSPRLIALLHDQFPESNHVHLLGLSAVDDKVVREYACENDYLIVTKDSDFSDLCLLLGFPPKIIWIRRGNCSTNAIESILRENFASIVRLVNDPNSGVLTIY